MRHFLSKWFLLFFLLKTGLIFAVEGFEESAQPIYEEVNAIYKKISEERKKSFEKEKSVKEFSGDNSLLAMPRIIEKNEFEQKLKKGVEQRSRALMAFLYDHYSGEKKYAAHQIVSKSVIDKIIKRSKESEWEGLVDPKSLAMWYGPDIIRDQSNQFRVVEDNPGFVGGIGDLINARKTFLKYFMEYEEVLKSSPDPAEFYKQMVAQYQAKNVKNGLIVLLTFADRELSDNEDFRVRKIFKDLGVEVVKVSINTPQDSRLGKKLYTTQEGLFLHNKNKPGQDLKVGFVITDLESHELEYNYKANRTKLFSANIENYLEYMKGEFTESQKEWHLQATGEKIEESITTLKKFLMQIEESPSEALFEKIEKYLKITNYVSTKGPDVISGFFEAWRKKQFNMSYTPALDFVGDKEFYIYIEDFIRFYLKEEPIIKNIETKSFALINEQGKAVLNKAVVEEAFRNVKKYVIKTVGGRGGDGVWVGPKISPEEIEALKKKIALDPAQFIMQTYTPLSVLDNHIVDLRLISSVNADVSVVSDIPWGRALPLDGNGKVNLSDQGKEVAVFCIELKKGILKKAQSVIVD